VPRTARRTWILLSAGWLAVLTALAIWLRTPTPVLREQLRVMQFWSLEICLVLVVALVGLVVRDVLRTLQRSDVFRMIVLAALAAALTLFVAPRTNRIYYDEQIYQGIGQNLSDLKLAQMCNDGTVEYGRLQCWLGEYNKQPYAWPHLLSVGYRAFGVSEWMAFAVNAVVMALTVCGVYLLAFLVFGDRTAAFFAGVLMAFIPQQLLWSATAAVEPSASLACVVALVSASQFYRTGSTVALAATAASAAYAVQFRPESLLIVLVIALFLERCATRTEAGRARAWAIGLGALALVAVHLGHLVAVRNEGWGTNDARLSFGYVLANLQVNGRFYLGDGRFPVVFTGLAVLGLIGSPLQKERLYFAAYFLLFFGIFLMFYAGSYNYGADVRYSLMTYPPIAVLGGVGAAAVSGWLQPRLRNSSATAVVTSALALQFLAYVPLVRATTEEAWAARADVRFARSLVPALRGNAYVLTHNPSMFHVWGVNAGQMSLIATNPQHLDYLAVRYAQGAYLHWNFWCNVTDPVQQGFCRAALTRKPVETVKQYRERDQFFALYRFVLETRHDQVGR
jgi:4-amino-4-deoxy-L-arabinose transferase-like glycosyltransferase